MEETYEKQIPSMFDFWLVDRSAITLSYWLMELLGFNECLQIWHNPKRSIKYLYTVRWVQYATEIQEYD